MINTSTKALKPPMTKVEREAVWRRIQAEAPSHAALLQAIYETFGRPKKFSITINGDRLL